MKDEIVARIPPLVGPALGRGARVELVHSLVDPERTRPPREGEREATRAALGLRPDDVAILSAGSVCDKKGQLRFLREAAPTVLDDPRAVLLFAGDFDPAGDPYARACEAARAEARDPARIRFLGHRDDVPALYRAADVGVIPSRYEGLARAMIEGAASGLPVVSFAVTSAREVLGGGAGIVVPAGDFEALARAVVRLVADRAAREAMSAAAVAVAARLFDADRQARRHEDLYRELVAEAGSPCRLAET
jgi:glycosyltransferase involved in cell wall biosynthesis